MSWPLGCCLGVASDANDLRRLAKLVQSGTLGNTESWILTERGWKGTRTAALNLLSLTTGMPWTLDSIATTPPFLALPFWQIAERSPAKVKKDRILATIRAANEAFQLSKTDILRFRLAQLCLWNWRQLPTQTLAAEFDPKPWIESACESISLLVPRPRFLNIENWRALLDLTNGAIGDSLFASPKAAVSALEELPESLPLLQFVARLIGLYAEHSFVEHEWNIGSVERIVKRFGAWATLSLAVRGNIGPLMVVAGEYDASLDREVLAAVASDTAKNPANWECLLGALQISLLPQSRIEDFLASIYTKIGSSHESSDRVMRQIRDQLQKRTSDLDSETTWNRLALPLPYPKRPLAAPLVGGIPNSPVRIESIDLQDIGGIRRLSFKLKQPDTALGQWAVLLGTNGSGKTTILRSLVLALRNVQNPSIWPQGVFGIAWQRIPPSGENSHINSTITVRLGDGVEHRTQFRSGPGINVSQLPQQSQTNLFPLFAYGCRRGSALGGATRQVNLEDDSGPEVATLFDDGADLIQAETWLVTLEGDIEKSPRSKTVYEAVISSLRRLLDIQDVIVAEQRLWFIESSGSRLPFSALSDGYLTQAGWFLDLIARWLKIAEQKDVEIDEGFLSKMRGLVLIDEIDLHLHPQWQVEIISRTRRLLPQMSFIVTTHNPLTLVGAQADEIWILDKTREGLTATSGASTPMLLTGGQLYRQYFGITDIYPNDLGRKLQRYSFLSGNALRNDEEQTELDSLQRELQAANADPSWQITPRALGVKNEASPKSRNRSVSKRSA